MAKSAGRTTTEDEGARLSVEDADRAAAAFVPLWQFDEAPFAASPKLGDAELHALSVPAAAAAVLAPTPAFSAPVPAAAPVTAPAPPLEPASVAVAAVQAATEQELLEARATVKMTPVHVPNPPRPTEPELPSVMLVESGTPAPVAPAGDPLRDKITVSLRAISPVKPDAAPESQREPKTDPALSRARPARRPMPDVDDAGAGYSLPRSRTPLLVGVGVLGSALLIVIVYAISSAMSGGPAAASSTTASAVQAEAPVRPAEPGAGIPPPPAVGNTAAAAPPPVAAPAPPPVAAPPPPVVAAPSPPPPPPVVNVTALPPAPPLHAAPPPPAPVVHATHTTPAARPRPPRNSTQTPASGAIVRDNPF